MEYFGRKDLLLIGIEENIVKKIMAFCRTSGYIKRKTAHRKNDYRMFTIYNTLDFKKSLEIKIKESPKSRFINTWKNYLNLIPIILNAKANDNYISS